MYTSLLPAPSPTRDSSAVPIYPDAPSRCRCTTRATHSRLQALACRLPLAAAARPRAFLVAAGFGNVVVARLDRGLGEAGAGGGHLLHVDGDARCVRAVESYAHHARAPLRGAPRSRTSRSRHGLSAPIRTITSATSFAPSASKK